MDSRGWWLRLEQGRWLGADAPDVRGAATPWRAYAWALVCVAAATAIGRMLFGRLGEANLIMVYLLAIVAVALRGVRGAAVLAAVLSVAAFDFFFVHPYFTLVISDSPYLFTLVMMGLFGVVVSTLTARLASQVTALGLRERRARALFELSRTLLSAQDPATVLCEGARVIGVELGQPIRAWLKGKDGFPEPIGEAGPVLTADDERALHVLMRESIPTGCGTGRVPEATQLFVPLKSVSTLYGALALPCHPAEGGPDGDVRATLETGANQLAIALEEARARAEAERAQHEAESERLRNALLSSVSHDLRTPLTGIVGAASTLVHGADAIDPDLRRELAQGIVEEADRLNRLVTNLLHATRLDAGSVQLSRQWFSIDEVVGPAVSRLATMLTPHRLEIDVPAELPLLHGDPVLIEQVLVNLLENAAKYSAPGTPIAVTALRHDDSLVVRVCDRGPGLPPGEEGRVFEKFRRFDGSDGISGAGLGLAICRGVLAAHGGAISAANRPEGGAVFTFSLPLPHAHSVKDTDHA